METIGGVVVAALGRLPRVGDTVRFGNLAIVVDRMKGRRIDRVVLELSVLGSEPAPLEAEQNGK